jgi:hypothetical protein
MAPTRTDRFTAALVAAILAAAVSPALADDELTETPRSRQGYYLAFGQNLTLAHVEEEGDGLGTFVGHGTTLRAGQLLTARFGLGLAIDFGGASNDPQDAILFALGVAGQAEVARNLAVHAGIGVGVVTLDDTRDDDEELRGAYGAAFTVGLSYDWFLGHRLTGGWALTPSVWLRAVPSQDVDAFVGLFGIEITYWTGLAKNQLALPPDQAYRD